MSSKGDEAVGEGSVSIWIGGLKAGQNASAQAIWERYFDRLVSEARRVIRHRRRAEDEEDAALSAFDSFCEGTRRGKFPFLSNRNNLWGLLLKITVRKAFDQNVRGHRLKRDENRARGESEFAGGSEDAMEFDLDGLPGPEPSPEFAAIVAEEFERRMHALGDDSLRQIAVMRLEGYTDEEIARRQGCTRRTVQRRLDIIREEWADG